jgi:bacteriocin-like protein
MSKVMNTGRELTNDELNTVSGGFESAEHGTLGSNPKDQQFNPDAVIDKAVGLSLANIKFF